jgi:hypothetical protein
MTTDMAPLYLHPHDAANAPVTLHEGPIVLRHAKGEATGEGRVFFRWLPSTGLRLEADLTRGEIPDTGVRAAAQVADSLTEVLISSVQHRVSGDGHSAKVGGTIGVLETKSSATLTSIGFQVVNFPDFLTPGQAPAPVFGFPPRMTDLRGAGWRIRLTAVEKSTEVFKGLEATGGYAFTHLGRLEKEDHSPFMPAEGGNILAALTSFLSFARGAASGIPLRWGVDAAEAIVWQEWGSAVVEAWKPSETWFDEHHGNLLSEIFPAFVQAYNDSELRDPLRLALHWFQKSNMRAGGMEGAIILGLTSLDLLGAMVLVDRASVMSASKYDGLKAAFKLKKLLETIKVPPAVPARLSNLAAFAAANGWPDAATALAEIRHGYVHPNSKRRSIVLAAPNLATFEAWRLSLWYQELALLYFLNHSGQYRNRVTAEWLGEVEAVPWA